MRSSAESADLTEMEAIPACTWSTFQITHAVLTTLLTDKLREVGGEPGALANTWQLQGETRSPHCLHLESERRLHSSRCRVSAQSVRVSAMGWGRLGHGYPQLCMPSAVGVEGGDPDKLRPVLTQTCQLLVGAVSQGTEPVGTGFWQPGWAGGPLPCCGPLPLPTATAPLLQ